MSQVIVATYNLQEDQILKAVRASFPEARVLTVTGSRCDSIILGHCERSNLLLLGERAAAEVLTAMHGRQIRLPVIVVCVHRLPETPPVAWGCDPRFDIGVCSYSGFAEDFAPHVQRVRAAVAS